MPSLRSLLVASAFILTCIGLTPVQAQPYTSVYVQAGRMSLTNNVETELNGFRLQDDETPPDVTNGGISLRAGFRYAQSTSLAFHAELGFQQSGPRSTEDIAADMRPEPGLAIESIETGRESGQAQSILLQLGFHYVPQWSRVGIVQPYLLVGVGAQTTTIEDYYVRAVYENNETIFNFDREVFYKADERRLIGTSGHAGLGLDMRFHSRYSAFLEVRTQYLYQGGQDLSHVAPHFGINIALNVDDELGRL